jgi:hypothetical protein
MKIRLALVNDVGGRRRKGLRIILESKIDGREEEIKYIKRFFIVRANTEAVGAAQLVQ